MAQAHFRRVKGQPRFAPGLQRNRWRGQWFTLDEVLRLRAFLPPRIQGQEYLPYRPEGSREIGGRDFKGGGQNIHCAHLAMSAALDGYKVLVIDRTARDP